jgi:hypothetical protein
MTGLVRVAAGCVLLAGPAALAFFSGGFFDEPRLVAAVVAWLLVAVAALMVKRPLPRSIPGRLALAGLAAFWAWTTLSIAWAPLGGAAWDDSQRGLLYLAALVAAAAFLGPGTLRRAVEPALAGGCLLVVCYGLSERLLPGLFELERSASAGGRLEQPLTYWNAMGALAATGVVLCARLAGDQGRPRGMRAAAAAAAVPLGAGVYLSFSRGAVVALGAGVMTLVLLAPTRPQLRAAALALVGTAGAALATGAFGWVRSLDPGGIPRDVQGLLSLAALAALAAAAAWLSASWARERAEEVAPPRGRGRRLAAVGCALVLGAVLAAAAIEVRPEVGSPRQGAAPARLGLLDTNRYDYWRVALETFADRPLAGTGAGGFRVEWLRERSVRDPTQEAHSLYLETLAELGVVGFAALLVFLLGVAGSARRAYRARMPEAPGAIAVVSTWATHAALDWDWEMPALTLVAILAAGALVALADAERA